MELRVLGAHNMESKTTRMESHLIDGVLVLDAGGLTRALSFQEQLGIRAVLLSHRHFDHVRDLLPLGIARRASGTTVDVYAIGDTAEFVKAKLLDGSLYPDFLRFPSPEDPVLRFHTVDFFQKFRVLDYTVMAVPVPHSVPAAGFYVSSGKAKLFYTGDAGEGLSRAWEQVDPEVLLTEVTLDNANEERAAAAGHLTPRLLEEALAAFRERRGYYPRVIVAHMNPSCQRAIARELRGVQRRLGVDILISRADTRVEL